MMATVGALALGLAAVTVDECVSAATAEEAMPDEDDRLTEPELRWCMFESVRPRRAKGRARPSEGLGDRGLQFAIRYLQ